MTAFNVRDYGAVGNGFHDDAEAFRRAWEASCAERDGVIARLREELMHQWEHNHFEHCSREWPHPEGRECYWPLPEVLSGSV